MKKLIIQIPCFNEEESLPATLADLPRHVEGVDCVEWLVIDDGSNDRTAEVARAHGVDHIVRHTRNRGLARAFFQTGINACLQLGADVIVNTDADNQYCADDIPTLATPIIRGEADLVVGERPIWETEHFSWLKKVLQRLGSWSVRVASGTEVQDAPSGFRAFSRDAALRLNVFNDFTYTLETIIPSGQNANGRRFRTDPYKRENSPFAAHQQHPALPCTLQHDHPPNLYHLSPLPLFRCARGHRLYVWTRAVSRLVFYYFRDGSAGHIQSLILATLLLGIGFFLGVIGLIADLISVNRRLLEQTLEKVHRMEIENHVKSNRLENRFSEKESLGTSDATTVLADRIGSEK